MVKRLTVILLSLVSALCLNARIVIENEVSRLTLSEDGHALSLWDKTAARECLDVDAPALPFCTLTQYRPYDNENFLMYPAKPKVFNSNRISYKDSHLYVEFDLTAHIAVIAVENNAGSLVFNLEKIDYRMESMGVKRVTEIDELAFVRLPMAERKYFGEWLNVCWDEKGGVCLMGLNPETRIDSYRDRAGLVMWAGAQADVALCGTSTALIVGGKEAILDEISNLEQVYGLPAGVDSRRRKDYNQSYYELRDVTVKNIDRHIAYAKKAGLRNMVVYYPDFAYTCGHFLWNEKYPRGMEDLKEITGRIKKAGMKAGFHIHYSKVSIDDPYVCSGIPDARLNTVLDLTLLENLDEDDSEIVVDGKAFLLVNEAGRQIVRVDDELIAYGSVEGNVLKDCKRAVLGTKASAHGRGSCLKLMDVDTWPRFIRLNQDTGIQDEIARNLARIYDEAGFDFLYFDGAEDVPNPYWYNVSKAQLKVYDKLSNKPVYAEGALKSHFGWHILTRGNAFDYFKPEDIRAAMKRYVLPCAERISQDFSSIDFGWVNYVGNSGQTMGFQPDMLEYICCKALAYDSPVSLMGNLGELDSHFLTDENLAVVKAWESAKINGIFSDEQKERMKDPSKEFILLDGQVYECRMLSGGEIPGTRRAFEFERDGKTYVVFWKAIPENDAAGRRSEHRKIVEKKHYR